MNIMVGALLALTAVQQTDTTFAAGDARELHIENDGGEIVVSVWDRDEVRIVAEHSRRAVIEVEHGRDGVFIEAEARGGMSGIVDYRVTVPRTFDLHLEGHYTDITVEGADGEVSAETMQGNILIRGGRGQIKAESTTGTIRIEGAEGTIEVGSVAEEIRISDSSGDIIAESVGGSIILENITASSVDAGSVGGRIIYTGTIERGGTYFFGSHGGTISLAIPGSTDAEFSLASLHGTIQADLPGAPQRFERGKRTTFTMGDGGAVVEAETFGGRITVRRQGASGNEGPR